MRGGCTLWVCVDVKGIVFKQFSLGWGIEIREFWLSVSFAGKLISGIKIKFLKNGKTGIG